MQTSQKKKKPPLPEHIFYPVLKAFIEGYSFKDISEQFKEVKYRSTAQWIVRKCQGKINQSIDVITESLQKDLLTHEQSQSLLGAILGALLRKDVNRMENLLKAKEREEIPRAMSLFDIEAEYIDEFFEKIRKYFEKRLIEEE